MTPGGHALKWDQSPQHPDSSTPTCTITTLSLFVWRTLTILYAKRLKLFQTWRFLTLESTHFKAVENSLWIFSGLPVNENQIQRHQSFKTFEKGRRRKMKITRWQQNPSHCENKILTRFQMQYLTFLPWLRTCNLIYSLHKLTDVLSDWAPLLHTVKACFGRAVWSRTLTYVYKLYTICT